MRRKIIKPEKKDKTYYPTAEPVVTSPYGERTDPFTGEKSNHEGTDYANDLGADLFSVRDGKIYTKGTSSKGTNYFWIIDKDGSGRIYGYWHATTDKGVDTELKAGDKAGITDQSGRSTGPHLHFTIQTGRSRDTRINPHQWLVDQSALTVKQ